MLLHVLLILLFKFMVLWTRNMNLLLLMESNLKTSQLFPFGIWFFFLQGVDKFVFNRCTYHYFFEEHVINYLWWGEVDFNLELYHKLSSTKQKSSRTLGGHSQGLNYGYNFLDEFKGNLTQFPFSFVFSFNNLCSNPMHYMC